eukprot:GILK01005567.1.p1 GENE.GILK01005567.1~~GILK01005567.1.p1  ORF type:complete len:168 (+),score=21.76 GILK01005567.1:39-506(+)
MALLLRPPTPLSLRTRHKHTSEPIKPENTLPEEILIHILSLLDASDLCRVSFLSGHWKELSNSNFLWKSLCSKRWNVFKAHTNWKAFYAEMDQGISRILEQHERESALLAATLDTERLRQQVKLRIKLAAKKKRQAALSVDSEATLQRIAALVQH